MSEGRSDLGHKSQAPRMVAFMTVTVSDSRTAETDGSGQVMQRLIAEAGYRTIRHCIVPDDAARVTAVLQEAMAMDEVDIVVLSGGTGVSSRDGTCEVVARLLDKRMDGFGEIFRALSYQRIGSPAMLSRALGGICRGKGVFAVPGSPAAVDLAMRALILPEAGHLMFEVRR